MATPANEAAALYNMLPLSSTPPGSESPTIQRARLMMRALNR
eukprot:CAMPEP_0182895308 /NCGR_PEP_ID=MMETSP0034_2-20130328/25606_1 /TAXON_ID=156128 /ORGANISM="Nephroselmis pyriformis, Strain CCMP717" /LENGTH=41 /DNA_ID= /DNA_START= /DNA_END= /DNA_ORIENTATION=